MLSGEGFGSVGIVSGLKMISAEKKALGGFRNMKAFIKACFAEGSTIETRMKKAKRKFIRIEMLVVRPEYQKQGFMKRMLDSVYRFADRKGVTVILDTDDMDKSLRYEHLGMSLDRIRNCGERFHMYDLIRENPVKKNALDRKTKRKLLKKYVKAYKRVLSTGGFDHVDERLRTYAKRLSRMYATEQFKEHNIYPTTDASYIYAVIAMCLELKEEGVEDGRIITTVNQGFERKRNFFKRIIAVIDRLPNSFDIVRKWNLSDHEKRVCDGSITYDYFKADKDKIEYHISKCMYVEMFATYGIRELCKIFCMTDETAYAGLTRHVNFIRHSDLSDGPACFDEVIRRK